MMRLARGVGRAGAMLVLAIGMTLGAGTAGALNGPSTSAGGLIRIQAYMDGRS